MGVSNRAIPAKATKEHSQIRDLFLNHEDKDVQKNGRAMPRNLGSTEHLLNMSRHYGKSHNDTSTLRSLIDQINKPKEFQ